MSLSAADTRWTDLLRMLAKLNDGIDYSEKEIDEMTWQEKTKLVQKDPVTCSRYFDHRVQEFLNTILKSNCEPIGKVKYYFYRVEFQQRGSPHINMLVWIENAPTLEKNSEEEIVQFVDQYLTCSADNKETTYLVNLQTHKHSRTCRKKGKPICRFGFPLPPLPKTMLLYPLAEDVAKYKKKHKELQKVMNEYKDTVDMTFEEFLEKVAKMNFENYRKRKVPRIIRYVRYNRKKDLENYYREQLMLFIPWRNEQKDLLASFDTFEAHYNSLKTSIEPKSNEYEHHTEELELARQMRADEENAYDQIAPNTEQENKEAEEEGAKEAENFVYFNPSRVVEQRHYDIGIELQSTCSVPPVETTGIMLPDEEYLTLVRSLNLRQREFFNHGVHWIKCKDEPIYAFLTGGAGVGNSVVVRALYQSLYRILNLRDGENPDDIRILLCAYMGFAAFNISGQTICSAFHKKIYQGTTFYQLMS